jgi:hypothetical protein
LGPLAEGAVARDPSFDSDVVITLSEFDAGRAVLYRYRGRHEASGRCVSPAAMRIKSANYAIDVSARPGDH